MAQEPMPSTGGKDGATGGGGGRHVVVQRLWVSRATRPTRSLVIVLLVVLVARPVGRGKLIVALVTHGLTEMTYGAGGLDGAVNPEDQVVPNSGNGGHAYGGNGSSPLVIVAVTV